MNGIKPYLLLGRPQNAFIPIVSFLIGCLYISNDTFRIDYVLSVSILILLFNLFATIQNDIEDYDIDAANGKNYGLHGKNAIHISQAKKSMYVLLLLVVLGLFILNNKLVTAYIGMIFILTQAYNIPPFYFSRKPIASVISMTLAVVTLPLTLGILSTDDLSNASGILLLVIALSLQRAAVIMLKDYKDEIADRTYNKTTLLIRYGFSVVKKLTIFLGIIGYCMVIASMYSTLTPMLFIVFLLVYGYFAYRNIVMRTGLKNSRSSANSTTFLRVIKNNYQLDLVILSVLAINVYLY